MVPAIKRRFGTTIVVPIIYGSVARQLRPGEHKTAPPGHTHKWTLFIRPYNPPPLADNLNFLFRRIAFKLHETFPNPVRNVDKAPFELHETGWGEFEIMIRCHINETGEKAAVTLMHLLRLFPAPVGIYDEEYPTVSNIEPGVVNAEFYNELIFNDPTERLYQLLTSHGYTEDAREDKHAIYKNSRLNASFEAFELERIQEAEKAMQTAMEKAYSRTAEYTKQLTMLRLSRQKTAQQVAQQAAAEATSNAGDSSSIKKEEQV